MLCCWEAFGTPVGQTGITIFQLCSVDLSVKPYPCSRGRRARPNPSQRKREGKRERKGEGVIWHSRPLARRSPRKATVGRQSRTQKRWSQGPSLLPDRQGPRPLHRRFGYEVPRSASHLSGRQPCRVVETDQFGFRNKLWTDSVGT